MPSHLLSLHTLSWWENNDPENLWYISDKRSNEKLNKLWQMTWQEKITFKSLWVVGESDLRHMNNLKELSKCVSSVFCTADLDQSCVKHWRVSTPWTALQAKGWDVCSSPRYFFESLKDDVEGSALWTSGPDKVMHCCYFNQRKEAVLTHILLWGLVHQGFKMTQTLKMAWSGYLANILLRSPICRITWPVYLKLLLK